MKLTSSVVDGRPGYVNEAKQTYATPKSAKRVDAWKAKLEQQGYTFEG